MKPNSIGIIKSVHVALIAAGLLALPLTARAVEQTVAPKAVTQAAPSQAVAIKKATKAAPAPQKAALAPEPALVVASAMSVTLGKSTLLRIPAPVARMSVGNPAVADVVLITPREIYILGKTIGSTNVILWTHGGQTAVIDVGVGMDTAALQGKIEQLMPGEKGIMVNAAADSLVLSGAVADAVKVDRAMALAGAYSGKKVINLLRVTDAQQVMLEVKVAEVSKTLVDKLGAKFNMSRTNGSWTYS
ncbi:MAG: pilus assembly protein N-terminal domain-containing protein, partial [Rhodocyclaceae bacterium]|nr:pilus assembly protein N-terminal domain-containing protein [Rhodocyclaceae bacterium]